jgi:hypothetical protein
MDDKDHVFARFKDDKPATSDRREMLSIPRRGNATGSRTPPESLASGAHRAADDRCDAPFAGESTVAPALA